MKQYIVIALGFLMLVPQANAQPAVLIAEYRFDTLMVPAPPMSGLYGTNYRYYMNPLVLSSAGNFYSAGLSTVNGGFFTTGHPPASTTNRGRIGANWDQTLNLGKYMGFSLTPRAGYELVIDSIVQWSAKSNSGPDTTRMRFSTNGYAANSWFTVNAGDVSWRRSSRTTGLPSSFATIQVRYYTYRNLINPNPSGTWRIDDIKVYGHLRDIFNLPIELVSFTGHAKDHGVDLNWITATETNNDFFTVYRLENDSTWQEIAEVPGAGNSTSLLEYSTTDPQPKVGANYYKLRQTDTDGQFEEFDRVCVIWKPPDKFTVFPNPSSLDSPVFITGEFESLMVTNQAGQAVPFVLQGSTLTLRGAPGMYYLQTQDGRFLRLIITP